jgi:hypothetical protein
MNYGELTNLALAGWGMAIILIVFLTLVLVASRPFWSAIIGSFRGRPLLLLVRRNGTASIIVPSYIGGAYECQDGPNRLAFLRVADMQAMQLSRTTLELAYDGSPIVVPAEAAAAVSQYVSDHPGEPIPDEVPAPDHPVLWDIRPLVTKIGSSSEILRAYADTKVLGERMRARGLGGGSLATYIGIAAVVLALMIGIAAVM